MEPLEEGEIPATSYADSWSIVTIESSHIPELEDKCTLLGLLWPECPCNGESGVKHTVKLESLKKTDVEGEVMMLSMYHDKKYQGRIKVCKELLPPPPTPISPLTPSLNRFIDSLLADGNLVLAPTRREGVLPSIGERGYQGAAYRSSSQSPRGLPQEEKSKEVWHGQELESSGSEEERSDQEEEEQVQETPPQQVLPGEPFGSLEEEAQGPSGGGLDLLHQGCSGCQGDERFQIHAHHPGACQRIDLRSRLAWYGERLFLGVTPVPLGYKKGVLRALGTEDGRLGRVEALDPWLGLSRFPDMSSSCLF